MLDFINLVKCSLKCINWTTFLNLTPKMTLIQKVDEYNFKENSYLYIKKVFRNKKFLLKFTRHSFTTVQVYNIHLKYNILDIQCRIIF